MITQNLFNKRPKTFMDYEPGKIPKKSEWKTQTITETKTHDPFTSKVKLVGDDVTEKDHDTFWKGFKSVGSMDSRKNETGLFQNKEPKITKLPFNPSQLEKIPKHIKFFRTSAKDGMQPLIPQKEIDYMMSQRK